MKKIKNRKISKSKKIIIILFFCLLLITLSITFGRYVYNRVLDFYFSSKNFYFESDKLTMDGAFYSLDYWNGVDPYTIVVNLNSFKNNNLKTENDITYQVDYECSSTTLCTSTKDNGVIYGSNNTDSFVVTMTPNTNFNDGDSVNITIKATSVSPYKKELSATFRLVVGKYGLSHEIVDSKNSPYLELSVTNTLNYYTVKEPFLDYNVNDRIDEGAYNALSDENKEKCASAIITVSFDPNTIYVDNNSTVYLNSYNRETEEINNYDYINKFTFKMDSSSSSLVKFYKRDVSKDYSNDNDIVTVSYEF